MPSQISLFRDFSYDVTVVMVSYHTGAALWRAIDSVLAQEGLNELILVDNGNHADTRQRLVKKNTQHARLKVLSGQGNIGLYRGYNLGAERAKGRYVLFISPETILPHDFLLRMVDGYQKETDCHLVTCPIRSSDGEKKMEAIRPIQSPWQHLCSRMNIARWFVKKKKNPAEAPAIFAPNPMCFMMDINHFKAVGGLNERYFYDMGHIDLALKIKDIGGKTVYLNNIQAVDFRTTHRSSSLKASWYRLRDTYYHFNHHFKAEYLPGVVASFNGLITLKWLLKLPFAAISSLLRASQPLQQTESERCARFLKTHESFSMDENTIPKGTLYDLSQRTPIMLAGVETDIGLCILRRLLAAKLDVIALYDKQVIDFEHENLIWLHSQHIEHQHFSHEHRSPMLVYASDIRQLPNLLENFSDAGIKRVLAVGSAYIFRLLSTGDKALKAEAKSYVLAEGDVVRTSKVLDIDTTLLRAGMTYGMGKDDNISGIARFIKRFRFLPLVPYAHGKRQPIHCDDLAINIIALINHKETYGKSYNIVGQQTLSYKQIVEQVFKLLSVKKRIYFIGFLPFISKILSPFSTFKNFNEDAVKRANDDVIFHKESLPNALIMPQRDFLTTTKDDIFPPR